MEIIISSSGPFLQDTGLENVFQSGFLALAGSAIVEGAVVPGLIPGA
jgi:hypothetical protein